MKKRPHYILINTTDNDATNFCEHILDLTQQVFAHGSSNHYIDRSNPTYGHALLNIRNIVYNEYKLFIFDEIRKIFTTPQLPNYPESKRAAFDKLAKELLNLICGIIIAQKHKVGNCGEMVAFALFQAILFDNNDLKSVSIMQLKDIDHDFLQIVMNDKVFYIDPWYRNSSQTGAIFDATQIETYHKYLSVMLGISDVYNLLYKLNQNRNIIAASALAVSMYGIKTNPKLTLYLYATTLYLLCLYSIAAISRNYMRDPELQTIIKFVNEENPKDMFTPSFNSLKRSSLVDLTREENPTVKSSDLRIKAKEVSNKFTR